MTRDTPAAGELTWSGSELRISPREVARLANCGPGDRWDDAVSAAIEMTHTLAQPRGRWLHLDSNADLEPIFPGETPVAGIAARGDDRWLFVVTIGPALEERVQALFDSAEFLDAVLLDAAGSAAAEAACDRLQESLCRAGECERYSPGYCGWSMQGQKSLFALLEPDRLAVELLDTMLMRPLKSVTGVVVRAPRDVLRVDPVVCAACDARGCNRRQARFSG